ncbi:MAG: TRAP transporter large permease subunit, partial [Novosphingobium sp.]
MPKLRIPAFILMFLALLAWSAAPAAAQSILRDAETEALLHDMATPLIKATGLDPANVDIVLVNDPSVNAFVAGGQAVYINSGLINEADTASEVQGVIAHELGHVTGGLGMATISSCAAFATVSGSSIATAVTIAKVSVPQMLRYGYSQKLAVACSATGGTLGVLIPPSGILVVYSFVTSTSIQRLFAAALVPGL